MDSNNTELSEMRAMQEKLMGMIIGMETRMNTRMDDMEKRMEKRMDSIEGNISSINSSIATMHTAINEDLTNHNDRIAHLETDVRYIKDNIKLGTCREKSFWKDGWLLSALMIPAAQLVSGYITTYGGPNNIIVVNDCKKNN